MNIWILDDDEAMCSLLSRQSQKLDWHIHALHHPRQLPEALQDGQPDLLLLDQLLPEKHGLDVLAGLQQAGRAFPVLSLSALGAPSDRIAGLEAGADDYLSKPFHFRELQLRVERLLRLALADALRRDDTHALARLNSCGHVLFLKLCSKRGNQRRIDFDGRKLDTQLFLDLGCNFLGNIDRNRLIRYNKRHHIFYFAMCKATF
jgi:DNA-binding response OmpR family regulator